MLHQQKTHLCLPDKGAFFERNPPSAEEILLRWMKSRFAGIGEADFIVQSTLSLTVLKIYGTIN